MATKPMAVIVDDGTREIPLTNKYGQPICKIHFRPADYSIIDRYNALIKGLDGIIDPLKSVNLKNDGTATFESDWAVVKQVEASLKQKINELFDMGDGEADAIFERRNPFSSVGGEFFCLRVISALGSVISDAVAEEAKLSQQRMNKYLSDIEPIPSPEVTPDVGDAPDNA